MAHLMSVSTTTASSNAFGAEPTISDTVTSNKTTTPSSTRVPQDVLYPAYTCDYRVVNGACGGLGMVANRFIKKGEMVLSESLEFLFADVQEGDHIILVGHEIASRESETKVPERVPITRDMLIRTHGVPVLNESLDANPNCAGVESYRLEVPWMLLNHSCDPNVIDSSHKEPEGEAIAARDIQQGEELTYDYTHQYYDCNLHSFHCLCEATNCRKFVTGFQGLTEEQKQKLWPHTSEYIRAKHFADIGQGPPIMVQQIEFPPRIPTPEKTMRMVVPGPSCSISQIALKEGKDGAYQLFANRDFAFGEEVYSFWNFIWPENGTVAVDMVSASHLLDGDAPEGVVMRVDPEKHGRKDSMGRVRFSGYDLMVTHSCEPNMVYNFKDEDEEDDWRSTFATRPIKKGEPLSIDFNTVWWDRSSVPGAEACGCGASNCRGNQLGFSHLTKEDQGELKMLSWRRITPPYSGERRRVSPGDCLSPHIHASIRKNMSDKEAIETDETDLSETSSNTYPSSDEE